MTQAVLSAGVLTWGHCGSKPICLYQLLSCTNPTPSAVVFSDDDQLIDLDWWLALSGNHSCFILNPQTFARPREDRQWRRLSAVNLWSESPGFQEMLAGETGVHLGAEHTWVGQSMGSDEGGPQMARSDQDALPLPLGSIPPPHPHPNYHHDGSGFCGQETCFSPPGNKLTLSSPRQMASSPIDCPSSCTPDHPQSELRRIITMFTSWMETQ